MNEETFDARGAARALRAAIARGTVDVTSLYGGSRGGPRIPCPLHRGDSANFEVYEDGGWRCHSQCGTGGDVFHFVAIRDLSVTAGEKLRGEMFQRAVRATFEALGVDLDGSFALARDGSAPGQGGRAKNSKPYPPPREVARLLANAHEPPSSGEVFSLGGRARPGVGTYATVGGLGLCVLLGDDVRKLRPKWAERWPPGKLFALYDARGSLATVHLRPDDVVKGKAKNPAKFNPRAFLMNEPMRALCRGESKDERNRARLLGYETALQSARSTGVLLVEGTPSWCAWSRWFAGPVGGFPGQEPTREWLARIPRDAPVYLDVDPDVTGLKYLSAALRELVQHEDVRISARTRWILDHAAQARREPDVVAAMLEAARQSDPRLLEPDELADGPRVDESWFSHVSVEERIEIIGEGSSFGAKWMLDLRRNKEDRVVASEGNLIVALKADERWLGVLGYNERSEQVTWLRKPPVPDLAGPFPREIRDEDASHVGAWYEDQLGVEFKNATIHRALIAVATLSPFDRVREYLKRAGAAWDGQERLERWLPELLGADDTPLVQGIGAKWLISAVARTMQPGCKADYVLVLEGAQGIGKSTALAELCPDSEYFTDAMPELRSNKDVGELVSSGVWICEIAELDAIAKSESSSVKAFLTRRDDSFRPAYGRYFRRHPRRVVFCATTNDAQYLRDATGNRRYWPVLARKVDLVGLRAWRDQLWGEAVRRFQSGEAWHLSSELEAEVAEEQESRREVDPWEVPIGGYLETYRELAVRTIASGRRARFEQLPGQCLEKLDISVSKTTRRESRRICAVLRALGWERIQRRDGADGRRRWAWEPTNAWLYPNGRGDAPEGGEGGEGGGTAGAPGDRVAGAPGGVTTSVTTTSPLLGPAEKANDSGHVTAVTSVTRARAREKDISFAQADKVGDQPLTEPRSTTGDVVTPEDGQQDLLALQLDDGDDFDRPASPRREEPARW